MKLAPIIHQQIMQLRWHIAACMGLMMALPLEDAIVNLWQGDGFYAGSLSLAVPLFASPLLAALVACANVQADFDEKRFFFWRSKPAGIKAFMLLKYVIGLLLASVIIALPFLFAFITCRFVKPDEIERTFFEAVVMVHSVSLLTYSLCFLCNVLIRKTARAWLVGMVLGCFLVVIPFILPLDLRTIDDVFDFLGRKWSFIWAGYCLTGVPSLAALILSVVAAARNWRLHTNLKGLLWTAAALALALMLLFTRQIANIKVLDEKEVHNAYNRALKRIDRKLLLETQPVHEPGSSPEKEIYQNVYVNAENNRIQFENISDPMLRHRGAMFAPEQSSYEEEGIRVNNYAVGDPVFKKSGDSLYVVSLYVDGRLEKRNRSRLVYEHAYLRSYNLTDPKPVLVSEIDLTEFLDDPRSYPDMVMRQIGNKIVAIVNQSCAVGEFNPDGQLKLLEKQQGIVRLRTVNPDRQFSVPMVPLGTLEPEDRIKLSLDLATIPGSYHVKFLDSRNDKYKGRYCFVVVSKQAIQRYEVVRWNDKSIICEPKGTRPFTILERAFGDTWKYEYRNFVQDGKLYTYADRSLVVFDIRSDRIQKLGHYVQPKQIEDIEVSEDGNILVLMHDDYEHLPRSEDHGILGIFGHLRLLKNPE